MPEDEVVKIKPKPFLEVVDGVLHVNPHEKQREVFNSKAKRILVLAGRQSGKCLKFGSKVVLKNGEHKNIENIITDDCVVSIDDDLKIVESKVRHLIDSGELPVYEMVTTSGRRVETSETHPFLTKDGWKELTYISSNDYIAVPHTLPIEGTEPYDDEHLEHLANSDIFWDRVESIEYVGDYQCYDLEIENTHNFVANDVFVHNTVCGPVWMYNEIVKWDERVQRDEVVTDAAFMAISPAFPLLDKKLLPVYYEYFVEMLGIAEYKVQRKVFNIKIDREDNTSGKYQLFLESAQKDESLASVTAAAIHCDELGMDSFKLKSWNEVEGRVGSTGGPILGTTTIYGWNWMRRLLYNPWKQGSKYIDVIRFESIDNPFFDRDLWENLKKTMPPYKFRMEYMGLYDRPAGRIYDQFDTNKHVIKWFDIPLSTKRIVGIDPGLVHHCTTWVAEIMPYEEEYKHFPIADGYNSVYIVYRTSLAGSTTTTKSNTEHAQEAIQQPDYSAVREWYGGSKSEKYFRADYLREGIDVHEPAYGEVEAGISSLYKIMKQNRFYVMDDVKEAYEAPESGEDRSIPAYSRKLDEYGNPTSEIKDKSEWHFCDTLRYVFVGVDAKTNTPCVGFQSVSGKSVLDAV